MKFNFNSFLIGGLFGVVASLIWCLNTANDAGVFE